MEHKKRKYIVSYEHGRCVRLESSCQECRDDPAMCPMQAIHGTIESLIWTGHTGDGSPVNLLSPFPTVDGHGGAI